MRKRSLQLLASIQADKTFSGVWAEPTRLHFTSKGGHACTFIIIKSRNNVKGSRGAPCFECPNKANRFFNHLVLSESMFV